MTKQILAGFLLKKIYVLLKAGLFLNHLAMAMLFQNALLARRRPAAGGSRLVLFSLGLFRSLSAARQGLIEVPKS